MGGVTKRAPLEGGIEYPVSGWTSLPQTKLIPAGVSKNVSPGGALLMAPPPEKGDILCPSPTPPYRWIAQDRRGEAFFLDLITPCTNRPGRRGVLGICCFRTTLHPMKSQVIDMSAEFTVAGLCEARPRQGLDSR